MDVVIPGLLISDLRAAENVKLLDAHHISHVLCLGWEYDAHRDMVHLKGNHVIEILDDEDANLLDHLPDCIAFISAAIDGGGVCLVHCQAGVSRSAAVVVAYMMARMGMTRDEALERLRGVRAVVDPNAGFMMQLEIFGAMGCRVDGENHTYRRYALGQMALEQSVTAGNLIGHDKGPGQVSFSYHKRDVAAYGNTSLAGGFSHAVCSSYFVEPMAWMAEVTSDGVSGKINCPKCDAKLGSFDWSGKPKY